MSARPTNGGVPARRAVGRWAWRLFRRDWRQHVLIVLLLAVSVAAAVGFACAAHNLAPSTGRADFGDADHAIRFDDADPARFPALVDDAAATFGQVDAIGHRLVPVPGSVKQVDYRAQRPDGAFGGPLLDLRSGRYPVADDEAAVTDWIASTLDAGIGGTVRLDGVDRTVVGIVENPSKLNDEFVLVPPSQLSSSTSLRILVHADDDQIRSFRPEGQNDIMVESRGDVAADVLAAIISLIVTTVVLFLVALIAAASFTVIAQRRLPQLGMMSAVGASEQQLRFSMVATGAVTGLVATMFGTVVGLLGWLLIAPHMEGTVGYRIDVANIPWWLVGAGALLAVLAATGAAWWPGRTMARIPTVAALSGRPPAPARLHRSAVLALAFLGGGVLCLAVGARANDRGPSTWHVILIIVGTLAVLCGVLLVGPIAIRGVAAGAARVPVASRLALRDLSRYQGRSGAALAAISLALGIPVAVVASTAAADNNLGLGNLSSSQLIVHAPTQGTVADARAGVAAIATALGAPAIELSYAVNPSAGRPNGGDGVPPITLGRPIDHGWEDVGPVYVASPELLAVYGLAPDALDHADIVTSDRSATVDILDLSPKQSGPRDTFEHLAAPASLPPTYSSLPLALISPSRLAARGWTAGPSGQWLVQVPTGLTSGELTATRILAAQYGLSIESRERPTTLADIRSGAVAIGMVLALGILAMTVGLIRSESAGELRTLTATGASSSTRRMITATTAGGLAGLGAVLGVAGAYIALAAGRISNLTPLPLLDLAIILIGAPLVAALAGWLFAGREPPALARRPIG